MRPPLRFVTGYVAVAAAVPYLVLKLLWLSGNPVGFTDPLLVRDRGLFWANLATAVLDLVAVLLALTFTHRWGMRVPAMLVVFPMWVGAGLLVPIVVAAPIATVLTAAGTAGRDATAVPTIEPWVFALVYIGFVVEGVALVGSFLLYVRRRWPGLVRRRGAVPRLLREIAVGAAVIAALAGAAHLAWAFGATVGLPDRVLAERPAASGVFDATHGALAWAGAIGVLTLGGRLPPWLPLALAWVGSASMFAWGAWIVANVLAGTVLMSGGPGALPNLVALGKLVAGLLVGVALAGVQQPAAPAPPPPVPP